MAVTNISQDWSASYWLTAADARIDDVNFASPADQSGTVQGGLSVITPPDTGSDATTYASRFTSTFTTDTADETTFHLTVCGAAEVYINGEKVIDLTSSVLPGAGSDGCLSTGAGICHCDSTENKVSGAVKLNLPAGEHSVEVRYLDHPLSDGLYFGWDADGSGGQEFDLTIPVVGEDDPSETGEWGDVFSTSIMGIHQVMLGDGRVLYWGDGGEGNAFSNTMKYAVYDPATGQHEVLDASFAVKMFCGAGVMIPGTDKVLIGGGNGSGENDGKIFDTSDGTLINSSEYTMSANRFYPTTVSLSSGQVVILGGKGGGNATPEIFTLGEGWRKLDGATDSDVGANWWYPKAWVNNKGEVVYIAIDDGGQGGGTNSAGTFEVMALDPGGDGSIRKIGEVPFQMDVRSTSVMYDAGKVLVMDHKGDLWHMDINRDEPKFSFALDLPRDRENSDMTVLADGRVLLNGGTISGNSQDYAKAQLQSVIYDPYSGEVSFMDSESVLRAYHSSSILLADGTVMSSGGGGLSGTKNFQNAQIFKPDYLFNEDGTLADRPEISAAPPSVMPGDAFTVTVDDASAIARMSFVKTGAVTHSNNMESGRMDLEFTVLSATQIEVSLPDNPHALGAGNWMLFGIDGQGVPSVAPIISVEPTVPVYEPLGTVAGELSVAYFNADVSSLDQVDFNGTPIFEDKINRIQENPGNGAVYEGGPADRFAAEYSGSFTVETAGTYTFYLTSDDGSRLSIDGQRIINHDGLHEAQTRTASITLDAGTHTLNAQYFEKTGGATMQLDWAGPGFSRDEFRISANSEVDPNPSIEVLVEDIPDETQTLTGTPGKDVFVIDGKAADYGWGETDDGQGVVVWNDTGFDLLYDFEEIRFNDQAVPLVQDPGTDGVKDIANVTQYLNGTGGADKFIIDGNSADYGWAATDDGEGIVVWGPTGFDLLFDYEEIAFNDRTVDLKDDGGDTGDPTQIKDIKGQVQYVDGTAGTDTFIIDGASTDYGWDATEDNTGYVVWSGDDYDLLYDVEQIQFNDQTVVLDDAA